MVDTNQESEAFEKVGIETFGRKGKNMAEEAKEGNKRRRNQSGFKIYKICIKTCVHVFPTVVVMVVTSLMFYNFSCIGLK